MNHQSHTRRDTLRFWGPTGLAGAAASTAVALLLGAALTAPAHSAPARHIPMDPLGWAPAVTSDDGDWVPTKYCFMRRHSWLTEEVGPIPSCRVTVSREPSPARRVVPGARSVR